MKNTTCQLAVFCKSTPDRKILFSPCESISQSPFSKRLLHSWLQNQGSNSTTLSSNTKARRLELVSSFFTWYRSTQTEHRGHARAADRRITKTSLSLARARETDEAGRGEGGVSFVPPAFHRLPFLTLLPLHSANWGKNPSKRRSLKWKQLAGGENRLNRHPSLGRNPFSPFLRCGDLQKTFRRLFCCLTRPFHSRGLYEIGSFLGWVGLLDHIKTLVFAHVARRVVGTGCSLGSHQFLLHTCRTMPFLAS